jgi:hypothetical protein
LAAEVWIVDKLSARGGNRLRFLLEYTKIGKKSVRKCITLISPSVENFDFEPVENFGLPCNKKFWL